MFIIYDLIFLIVTLIHLPLYLLRGKFHHGFAARLGILPDGLHLERPVWVHAVSVGEAIAVKNLVLGLKEAYPDKKFVISTVTATGNKIVRSFAGADDFVTYLPLDFSFCVAAAINKIKPSVFIIAETELWPNLIMALSKKNIPVLIVNGRISDASFKGYSMIKLMLKPTLDKVDLFCLQSETDKRRLEVLGVKNDRIRVTGNMKFDAVDLLIDAGALIQSRRNLALAQADKLWVCGSTHPGEEETILKAYGELLIDLPALKLLIAPRHPERASKIEKLVTAHGFIPLRISQLCPQPATCSRQGVFILDTIGALLNYYAIADIVFVGGSLVKKGGHNILEPAMMEKPILIGPHMFNFRDIAELFLSNEAAVQVNDREGLARGIKFLLSDAQACSTMACAGRKLILVNQGATVRNIHCLKDYLH